MGDRTSVTLYFLACHKEKVDEILKRLDEEPESEDVGACDGEPLCVYQYSEINYGTLDCLKPLAAAGIAYDSCWEAGGNYGPGSDYCRFNKEGEGFIKSIDEDELSIPVQILLAMVDRPSALIQYIKARHEQNSVLPWTNQAEYGPTYVAMQLISR